MDNRETLTPSSGDAILKRHLFSEVARNWIKGRGHIERAYFVRRPSRQSFGFRVAASSGPIPKAPGSAGGYLLAAETSNIDADCDVAAGQLGNPNTTDCEQPQAAGKRDFPHKVGIAKSAGGIRTTGEDPDRREGVYCFAALVVGRPFDLRDPLQFGSRWN